MSTKKRAPRPSASPSGALRVTSTQAQNEFGRILDTVAQDRVVVITRHNAPRAVVMSIEQYNALSGVEERVLDSLTEEFDALLERMQTEEAREGMKRAFDLSPEELGRAALAEARRRGGS